MDRLSDKEIENVIASGRTGDEAVDVLIEMFQRFRAGHPDAHPAVVQTMFFDKLANSLARYSRDAVTVVVLRMTVRLADLRDGVPGVKP